LLYYSFGWATGFLLFYFWMTDALAIFIMVLALYCIRTGREVRFAALLALGVATKESVLFIAPLYYTLSASRLFDPRLAGKTALLALPAIATVLVSRLAIPVANPNYYSEAFAYYSNARANGTIQVTLAIAPAFRTSLLASYILDNIATFGMALMLPFLAVRRNLVVLLRYAPFLLLVNAQLLAAEATERLLVYAFPAIIVMALHGLSTLGEKLALNHLYLLPVPLAWFGLTLLGSGWMWTFIYWQAVLLAAYLFVLVGAAIVRARMHEVGVQAKNPAAARGSARPEASVSPPESRFS
jgi:hypothetical protein